MKERVMVVAAHPDDETLGCGGTILKHRKMGDIVYWLIMTNISTQNGFSMAAVKTRQDEIGRVVKAYHFKDTFKLNLPTTRLGTIPRGDLIKNVSKVLNAIRPNIVYLPYRGDVHSDHKITFDVVMSSIKIFRAPYIKSAMSYETISDTEFSPPLFTDVFMPNAFSNISEHLEKKIDIMKIYKNEIGVHPFPRSAETITAKALLRGAEAGCRYAEAFMILKKIW